jgi:hypothetical protein
VTKGKLESLRRKYGGKYIGIQEQGLGEHAFDLMDQNDEFVYIY